MSRDLRLNPEKETRPNATPANFEGIVGESSVLQRALKEAEMVAASDAAVLILGETGTGKELVARAIHNLSLRRAQSFVKVNCAALPAGLIESELFGHEKGAFTHATDRKIGRLEIANDGTFFLDEIGDLPLEVQPKLLRVLQEHEFERLGSTRTIRVNVRLIAATNHDLTKSVSQGRFRSDLFYRLSVFPIRIPPLRERSSDIPLLIEHFVRKFSLRMKKKIEMIPGAAMDAMMNWEWPGNVRELENFIERSVILTEGSVLLAPIEELGRRSDRGTGPTNTLNSVRREHIIKVLRETGGVVGGPGGAAVRLGLKRTTLQSAMKRLGITRRDYED